MSEDRRRLGTIWGGVLEEPRRVFRREQPVGESETDARKRIAQEEREHAEYLKRQTPTIVTARDLDPELPDWTLVEALDVLERNGGTVTARSDGSLHYVVPERHSANNITHRAIRREVIAAIKVLDAGRVVTHDCITTKKPLPDAAPAAGGGVAA